MNPSIISCSTNRRQKAYEQLLPKPYSQAGVQEERKVFISDVGKPSPFLIPCKCFNQPEALIFADLDYTFAFTDGNRNTPWAHPNDKYPASQVYLSTFLTPRLIGNYNIGTWNVSGLEYFIYRRPESYIYALSDTEDLFYLPPGQVNLSKVNLSNEIIKFVEKVQTLQPDGLDLFISHEDLAPSLAYALQLVKEGGVALLHVEEPNSAVVSEAVQCFEDAYLFKPMLFSPFTKERYLVLLNKKRGNFALNVKRITSGTCQNEEQVESWLIQEHNALVDYADAVKKNLLAPISTSKCYVKWKLPERAPNKDCWQHLNYWQKEGRTSALAYEGGQIYLAESGKDGGWKAIAQGYRNEEVCPLLYL